MCAHEGGKAQPGALQDMGRLRLWVLLSSCALCEAGLSLQSAAGAAGVGFLCIASLPAHL